MIFLAEVIGSDALYLLYAWLLGCMVASWLSDRKGYGERPGLATGLLLSLIAIVIWLVIPPRPASICAGFSCPSARRQGSAPWGSSARPSSPGCGTSAQTRRSASGSANGGSPHEHGWSKRTAN